MSLYNSIPSTNACLNPMNFTENQQGNVVLEKLRQQRETGRFCDVVLVVQGKQFPAHRNILGACSPYFDSILKMHKVVKEQVTVNCQNAEVFELLLNYMYSGSVVIDRSNVTELLKLSNNFLVSKLKNYCAEYLDRYLDVTNCLTVKDLAEKYNMPGLMKNASLYIETHTNQILTESHELLDFSESKLQTLFCDKALEIPAETRLLCAIRWCCFKFDERCNANLRHLIIDNIDFRRLTKVAVCEILDTCSWLTVLRHSSSDETVISSQNEYILTTVLNVLKEKNLLPDKYILFDQQQQQQHSINNNADLSVYLNVNPHMTNLNIYSNTSNDYSNVTFAEPMDRRSEIAYQTHSSDFLTLNTGCFNSVNFDATPHNLAVDQFLVPTVVDKTPTTFMENRHADVLATENCVSVTAPNRRQASEECSPFERKPTLASESSVQIHAVNDQQNCNNFEQSNTTLPTTSCNSHFFNVNENVTNRVICVKQEIPDQLSLVDVNQIISRNDTIVISDSQSSLMPSVLESGNEISLANDSHLLLPPNSSSSGTPQVVEANCNIGGGANDATAMEPFSDNIHLPPLKLKLPRNVLPTSKAKRRKQPSLINGELKKRSRSSRPSKRSTEIVNEVGDDFVPEEDISNDDCQFPFDAASGSNDESFNIDDLQRSPRAEILFQCPHCVYKSACQSRIQSHIDKAHSKNRTFTCTVCNYQCKWNREYYMHMKMHFQGPPFHCDKCDYAAERIQMLLTHRMKHTDERPYKCQECDYRCRTKTNLVAHMRSHTGEKPFTCTECGRGFAIKSTLDQHLATHSDARPFVCDQCSFSTKYQSHLISHKRIHTGDVFHCQYPDCSYSSPKKSQLAAHMRTHMAVRAHACKVCGRSFIEKSHLVRHERIHLTEKPFKCNFCNYASSRRDKLKEHVLKHHHLQNSAVSRNVLKSKRSRKGRHLLAFSGLLSSSMTGGRNSVAGFLGVSSVNGANAAAAAGCGRISSMSLTSRPHSSVGFRPLTPLLPMNFPFDNQSPTSGYLDGNGDAALRDVLLGTQVTPASGLESPNSTNSLLSDPLPSAATPLGDPLQRPMSLPPLGGGQGGGGGWGPNEFGSLSSFMAMF